MVLKKVNRLVAFDFDDTLAETGSLIGARFSTGDMYFEDFLFENNIHFVEFNHNFWWVDSANYAILEDLRVPDGHKIEYDYAQTMQIDLDTIKDVHPLVSIMRESIADENALTMIITARAGEATTFSPSLQRNVTASNRSQIKKFLSERNIEIPDEHIHTVGEMMEDTSLAKAHVISEYIKKYSPESFIFYDDSERNLRSASNISQSVIGETKLMLLRVNDGQITEYNNPHKKGIKDRLREILIRVTE
tara:strand:+ start:443 stop:1186 length:744 start_codon:yes stop_codon:yes gene_type:complete